MSEIQAERLMSVTTALEDDVLLFYSMSGVEEVGRLYEFEVDLLSEEVDIEFEKLLGEPLSVQLEQSDGEPRFFNGYVSRFSQVGSVGNYLHYRASVRPWFWFLTRSSNCRIFQSMTVPDIIKQIFGDYALADFEEILSEPYRTWDYCVQYRESDYNFISRLMEQEGIYFYFKHSEGKNTLVLADSMSAHEAVSGYEVIPYFELNNMTAGDRETITGWNLSMQVQPGAYATTDYDFENPKASLMSKLMNPKEHSGAEHEIYDYPGEFVEAGDGERYARVRLEEIQSSHHRADGTTNARGMVPGMLFTLENHLRDDQNCEYLVVSARYSLQTHSYGTGGSSSHYECSFSVKESRTPFRSARTTPKPIVQGPQTAVVVGPSGETIWPDQYGRVKVQFYWDREGKMDENSSCWVRVSQNRAGKNWGESYIPHVGHEVIVSFLEGDPDRPIVTGRVYNNDNMPPIELPAGKTQLGMRDQGGNEIIMEGEEGSQSIHTQQACGNEMLMEGASGEEKIEIRDKYGNEVVLDAVEGTIRIYSPSHESEMVLGRSITLATSSNWINNILGDKVSEITGVEKKKVVKDVFNTFFGWEHKNIIGGTSKFIGGVKVESILGAETKTVRGAKKELVRGAVFKQHIGKDYSKENEKYTLKSPSIRQLVGNSVSDYKEDLKTKARRVKFQCDKKESKYIDLTMKSTGNAEYVFNQKLEKFSELKRVATKMETKSDSVLVNTADFVIKKALKIKNGMAKIM